MEHDIQPDEVKNLCKNPNRNLYLWVATVILSAWLIAMGIVIAGWLIAQEMAKNVIQLPQTPEQFSGRVSNFSIQSGMPSLGSNDAPVTVVEFADFQCPFCGAWQKNVWPEFKREFIDTGKVKFVYWDFAFLGEESLKAAEAAACANQQGKFWEYHDALFAAQKGENEGAFNISKLNSIAKQLKLDTKSFSSCMAGGENYKRVQELTSKAANLGITATPTIVINKQKLEGVASIEEYRKVIDAVIKR